MADAARETAASYDLVVDSYEAAATQSAPERTAFRTAFADRVGRPGVVLDAGCGPGLDLDALTAAGLTALGLDSSPGMAQRSRTRGHGVVVADLRRVPLRPRSLDGLWSSASLLHVPRAEVGTTLVGWHRLLRPGGVLGLITSLGPDEGWEAVPYAAGTQHAGAPLRRWFVHHERDALTALLAEAGFALEVVEERTGHRRWLHVLATSGG